MQFKQVGSLLKNFSQTATLKHSSTTFTGTVINGILGLIYFFYLSTKLTPEQYGQFSVLVALSTIGFSVLNMGLEQSIIKFKLDPTKLSTILFLRYFISTVIILIPFLVLSPTNLYSLIGLGIGSKLLFSLAVTFFQSWQKYTDWSIYFVGTNSLRLLIVLLIPLSDPFFHLIVYSLIPMIGFLVFIISFSKTLPIPIYNPKIIKDIFRFNIPLSINSIISAINSRIDTFFIAGFQGFALAGFYDLSIQLSSSISQLTTAYSAAIAPKYSSFDTPIKNSEYLKKNTIFSLVIGCLLVPFLLFIGYLLFTLTGKDFYQAFMVLLFLLLGYTIFFISVPLRDSLLYYYGDSKVFLNLSVISMTLSVLSGVLFIRPYGPIAASVSFLIIQTLSVILLILRYAQNRRTHHS